MSDAIAVTVNFPEWVRALKAYESEVVNHDLPYILNKRGLNIAAKASRFTPRETKENITAIMRSPATGTSAKGRPYGPWLFVLANAKRKREGLPATGGAAISSDAQKLLAKRRQGVAYIAAGWIPAIVKFGGHPKKPVPAHSLINRAQNKVATAGDLIAILENTAKGSGKVGEQALQKAIEVDTQDMLQHVARLQKTAKKYSAK